MHDAFTIMQSSLVQALEDLHTRIAATALGLDAAALNWQPTPAMLSLRGMIIQAASLEYQWIGEGVGGVPAAEAGRSGMPAQSAGQLPHHALFDLGSVGQISQTILVRLPPSEWASPRQVGGRITTVADCVLQTLIELSRVLGHMENVAQLWKIHHPQPD
jgi:hypothetical protein